MRTIDAVPVDVIERLKAQLDAAGLAGMGPVSGELAARCPLCQPRESQYPLTIRPGITGGRVTFAVECLKGHAPAEVARRLGELGIDLDGGDALASETAPSGAGEAARVAALFVTARELRARTPERVAWVWRGVIARGRTTLPAGKPKVGKTTLIAALIDAIITGAGSFLGREVAHGPVVLVSEEGDSTLREKLADHDGLHVLSRDAAQRGLAWTDLVHGAILKAQQVGAVLVVIDTFRHWAGLPGDSAFKPGPITTHMAVVHEATAAGLAVLLVHHQRKAGGEDGDAIADNNALAGAVDATMEIEYAKDGAPATHRQIVMKARWADAPGLLVYDYQPSDASWRVVGEADGRAAAGSLSHRDRLLSVTPTASPGITEKELAALIDVDPRKVSGPLRELLADQLIVRDGGGVKGDPYLYRKLPPDSPPSQGEHRPDDSPLPLRGGESESDLPPAPPSGRDGGPPTLVEALGSEDAAVRALARAFDATEDAA